MRKYTVLISLSILLIFCAIPAFGTEWLYFIESSEGNKHFIDLDSLKRDSENIVSLKRKVASGKSANHAYMISDIEMDCNSIKMRTLSEISYGTEGQELHKSGKKDWTAIDPEGIDESLYELACSLRKKRNR